MFDKKSPTIVAAKVRRQAGRRSVEWLCRRGDKRFPIYWVAGDGRRGGGGSGCWRADRRAVCGRRERAARPGRLSGRGGRGRGAYPPAGGRGLLGLGGGSAGGWWRRGCLRGGRGGKRVYGFV